MTPSHASKQGRRYRYYVTRPDLLDGSAAWRVSGHDLERLVCERLSRQLCDQQFVCDLAGSASAEQIGQALANADLTAAMLRSGLARERAAFMPTVITRIDIQEECIELSVNTQRIGQTLGLDLAEPASLSLLVAATKVRQGHQLRLVVPGPQSLAIAPTGRDEKLIALLAEAQTARRLILASPDQPVATIAASAGRCRTRLAKLAALACLAPDIVTAIVEGRQPTTLNARTLQDMDLPLAWGEQRALLGFD